MPWILIKNNLKLMLRNKWNLLLVSILPVITIALLSNAFREMMDTSYKMKEFQVGYRMDENSIYREMMPELQAICKENNILLQEYPAGDITKLLQSEAVAVFVDITKNSLIMYQSKDRMTEASIVESIFSGFFYQVNLRISQMTYGSKHDNINIPIQSEQLVKSEKLNTEPMPSSTDYYGIIYIVYFTWCGIISLSAVISSERKSAILKRVRIANMSKLSCYFGYFIPCSLAIFIEIVLAWIISVLLFDIHWGNIGVSAFIILLTSMAAAALGIVLYQLFYNVAVSIVLAFTLTWIAGFFGGSFETYMYTSLSQSLQNSSPIYYINRTLVEYSTKGYSDYTEKCILYLVSLILGLGLIGSLLMKRKMEEQ